MSDDEKSIDEVFEDRNLLACAVVEAAPPGMGGWTPAPDADGDEWAIVWLETSSGQVSWHVQRSLAEDLTARNDDYDYDGHSRAAKNDRLTDWVLRGCPY